MCALLRLCLRKLASVRVALLRLRDRRLRLDVLVGIVRRRSVRSRLQVNLEEGLLLLGIRKLLRRWQREGAGLHLRRRRVLLSVGKLVGLHGL